MTSFCSVHYKDIRPFVPAFVFCIHPTCADITTLDPNFYLAMETFHEKSDTVTKWKKVIIRASSVEKSREGTSNMKVTFKAFHLNFSESHLDTSLLLILPSVSACH